MFGQSAGASRQPLSGWRPSQAATPSRFGPEIGASSPGAQGRALASGLRKLGSALRSSGTAALFLNQTRASELAETSTGGPALKLAAAARISLRGVGGPRIRFRVLKNKAIEPFGEGDLLWRDGSGFAECP